MDTNNATATATIEQKIKTFVGDLMGEMRKQIAEEERQKLFDRVTEQLSGKLDIDDANVRDQRTAEIAPPAQSEGRLKIKALLREAGAHGYGIAKLTAASKLSRDAVARILRQLRDEGVVKTRGQKRATVYLLKPVAKG